MPGLLDSVLQTGNGILSKFGSSGGLLSSQTTVLKNRLSAVQNAGTPQAKAQALMGTLGTRIKAVTGGTGGTSTHAAFQIGGIQQKESIPPSPTIRFK